MGKTVFLDFDGTYAHNGVVPPAHVRAVGEAQRNGHRVLLCTGRPKALVAADDIAVFDGLVAAAGGYVEVKGEVLAVDAPALARLRAELEGARLLLEATREHLAELRTGRAEALASERTRAEAEHARAEELAGELARTREELRAARAERDALRELAGLPWWRRLLPLPGPVSN
mgnify:CR=1 FL=1